MRPIAVLARLADKWGNPVRTRSNTFNIVGVGSVEINSVIGGAVHKEFDLNSKVTGFVPSVKTSQAQVPSLQTRR